MRISVYQTDRQIDRQTGRQTDRQTDRQTEVRTEERDKLGRGVSRSTDARKKKEKKSYQVVRALDIRRVADARGAVDDEEPVTRDNHGALQEGHAGEVGHLADLLAGGELHLAAPEEKRAAEGALVQGHGAPLRAPRDFHVRDRVVPAAIDAHAVLQWRWRRCGRRLRLGRRCRHRLCRSRCLIHLGG